MQPLSFQTLFTRTFPLNSLINIPDLVYMHEDTKQVVSTHANGFLSSLQSAQYNRFKWRLTPDDVWLYVLQNLVPLEHTATCPQSVTGLVYEQCVNQLFDNVKHPLKHMYDFDFTTSTYASKLAAKITFLSERIHDFSYSFRPIATHPTPLIHLEGTTQDWDKLRTMFTELITSYPVLESMAPFIIDFSNTAPLYTRKQHMGVTYFKASPTLEVSAGFIGATLHAATESISPNITWYIAGTSSSDNCVKFDFPSS